MRKGRRAGAAWAGSVTSGSTSPRPVPPAGTIPAAWRYPRSGPWTSVSDVIIALVFLFLSLFGPLEPEPGLGVIQRAAPVLYFLLVGACVLAMVVRRHSPLLFIVVAGVCLTAHLVLFAEFSIFFIITGLVAVETTQSRLEAPWRWVGLVLELVGAAMATTRAHELIGDQVHAGVGRLIILTNAWLVVAVAAFVGAARRRSRDRYNQAFERAAVLEAQQAAERRLAVIETQQRIARDVHDLLGHSLTVIAMQAEGARAILATDPDAADEALAVIGETSRRSVDEVHALVDILRSDAADSGPSDGVAAFGTDTGSAGAVGAVGAGGTSAGTGGSGTDDAVRDAGEVDGAGTGGAAAGTGRAALGQEQGADLLREPVRQARRVGLPVTLEADPTGRIPEPAAQVLRRVVQESLTNVLRHAPGAATTVSLRTGAGRAVLVVENAPAPADPPAPSALASGASDGHGRAGDTGNGGSRADRPVHRGFGLIGMRGRVSELGGSLAVGPTDEGGWRVTAELPAVPE